MPQSSSTSHTKKPQLTIVIPVLGESGNVLPLIDRIHATLDGYATDVLFIDDSKDDLTVRKVSQVQEKFGNDNFSIEIYHRKGRKRWGGLSGAVCDGITRAESDRVIVMDGDLQHPPETIPILINASQSNDIVVASRYCYGGSANGLNGGGRHIVSRMSTWLAKKMFPRRLQNVSDPMTGFFSLDKTKLQFSRMRPSGFKILLEILGSQDSLSVTEVPLRFAKRGAGESHTSAKQGYLFFKQLIDLKSYQLLYSFKSLPKFFQFGVIGGSVFMIGMGLLYFLVDIAGWSPFVANALQLAVTFWLNYWLNRNITWSHRQVTNSAMQKFLLSRASTTILNYYLFALFLSMNFSFAFLGRQIDLTINYLLANVFALAIVTIINYIVSDRWAFAEAKLKNNQVVSGFIFNKYTLGVIFIFSLFAIGYDYQLTFSTFLAATGIILFFQATMETWRMLYSYREPEAIDKLKFPEPIESKERFCLLVPARHESAVLSDTLEQLASQSHLDLDIVTVICDDDPDTLGVAYATAEKESRVSVIEFPMNPDIKPNKPKQLNYAFNKLKNNGYTVFGIIDAEDTVHPDLLRKVDTAFNDKTIGVVQGGVQLMNHDSSWYSLHNVLEYYRWFNSAMAFHAAYNFMPLGGNTVFIRTKLLKKSKGWPETLTEDCSLGVLLSTRYNAKTAVYYEPSLATREETPDSIRGLFKQRVRWNQGFFHEWKKGVWTELPSFKQRILADYVLISPVLLACISLFMICSIIGVLTLDAPVVLVMIMYLPLIPGALLLIINTVFLYDFGKAFDKKVTLKHYVLLLLTSIPYQLVLNTASLWSVVRELRGDMSWHKTAHTGQHRVNESFEVRLKPAKPAMELQGSRDG